MTKVGLIQTSNYENNKKGIENVSKLLKKLGTDETEIVSVKTKLWESHTQLVNVMLWLREHSQLG